MIKIMFRAINWTAIWYYFWRITIGLAIGGLLVWLLFGCVPKPVVVKSKPQKAKIRQYKPEAETKTAQEQIDELTADFNGIKPQMYPYTFPIMIDGKLSLLKIKVYYWEISRTHYVELVVCNGKVLSTTTKEKLRDGKTK